MVSLDESYQPAPPPFAFSLPPPAASKLKSHSFGPKLPNIAVTPSPISGEVGEGVEEEEEEKGGGRREEEEGKELGVGCVLTHQSSTIGA